MKKKTEQKFTAPDKIFHNFIISLNTYLILHLGPELRREHVATGHYSQDVIQ